MRTAFLVALLVLGLAARPQGLVAPSGASAEDVPLAMTSVYGEKGRTGPGTGAASGDIPASEETPAEDARQGRPDSDGDWIDAVEGALAGAGFDRFADSAVALGGVNPREALRAIARGELRWDDARVDRLLERLAAALKTALWDALAALAMPVLLGALLRVMLDGRGSGALGLLCRLSCAGLLMARYVRSGDIATDMLRRAGELTDGLTPILASTMALTGADAASTVLSSLSAVCAGLTQRALRDIGLPLCGVAAAVACAANLSERFQLNRLFALLQRVVAALIRLALAAFVAAMAVEGLLASGKDAPLLRAVQRAMRGTLPVIGRQASDAVGGLVESARAIRGAVGVAGMAVILSACAEPVARLAISMLSLRLAEAVLEPVADPGVVRIIAHFAGLERMLLAICAGCALMAVLLIGACLALAPLVAGAV